VKEIVSSPNASRPAMGPTLPPLLTASGVKAAGELRSHSTPHLVPRFGMNSDVIYSPSVPSRHVKGWGVTRKDHKNQSALLGMFCYVYRNRTFTEKFINASCIQVLTIRHTKDIRVLEDPVNTR
jgi:hypothetical protein